MVDNDIEIQTTQNITIFSILCDQTLRVRNNEPDMRICILRLLMNKSIVLILLYNCLTKNQLPLNEGHLPCSQCVCVCVCVCERESVCV